MNEESKYYEAYYEYVLRGVEHGTKELKSVFNIIKDLTDRRGLKHEYQLQVGLYLLATGQRLPASGPHSELGDRVLLPTITITP